jgi:hypothetical protein
MSDRPLPRAARVLVPVAGVALAFGGFAIAYAATDSGSDTPHDLAERGRDPAQAPVDDDTQPTTDAPNPAASTQPSEAATFILVNLPDGSTQTFTAGPAGTVTIGRTAATLNVVAVGTNPDWTAVIEQASGPEVEVEFHNGTARVDLEAELEDGAVRVRVRERTEVDDDDDDVTPLTSPLTPTTRIDNSGPGSVDSGHDGGNDSGSHSGSDSGSDGSGSGHSGSGG